MADGAAGMRAGIAGLVVSTGARQARYVPFGEATLVSSAGLDRAGTLRALAPVLEDPAITQGRPRPEVRGGRPQPRRASTLAGIDLDTMLAAYLLDASRSSQELEPVALEQLGYKALTADEVCGKGAKAASFTAMPPAALLDFAGERADLSLAAGRAIRARARSRRSRRASIAISSCR